MVVIITVSAVGVVVAVVRTLFTAAAAVVIHEPVWEAVPCGVAQRGQVAVRAAARVVHAHVPKARAPLPKAHLEVSWKLF
jgi:hypothetical protein